MKTQFAAPTQHQMTDGWLSEVKVLHSFIYVGQQNESQILNCLFLCQCLIYVLLLGYKEYFKILNKMLLNLLSPRGP